MSLRVRAAVADEAAGAEDLASAQGPGLGHLAVVREDPRLLRRRPRRRVRLRVYLCDVGGHRRVAAALVLRDRLHAPGSQQEEGGERRARTHQSIAGGVLPLLERVQQGLELAAAEEAAEAVAQHRHGLEHVTVEGARGELRADCDSGRGGGGGGASHRVRD